MLLCDLSSYKIDICIITKTWFKSKHDVSFTSLASYTLYRHDREGRKGGGVAIYVHENLCPKENLYHVARKDFELLWIQLTFQSCHFIIGAVYHPPNQSTRKQIYSLKLSLHLPPSLINSTAPSLSCVVILTNYLMPQYDRSGFTLFLELPPMLDTT